MSGLLATYGRELRAFFLSPLAYVILVVFLLSNGRDFLLIVSHLSDPRFGGKEMPLFQLFLGGTILFWLLAPVVPAVLTMRLIAEERRSGTIESLMTAPVSAGQVVVGKYLAALSFYAVLWLPTLLYVVIIARSTAVEWGPVLSGYLGILLIAALFLAVGTLCSSFAKNQVAAAVAAIGISVALLTAGFWESLIRSQTLRDVLIYISPFDHLDELTKGIVDTRRLVFYLSTTVLLLFLAGRTLEAKKWR